MARYSDSMRDELIQHLIEGYEDGYFIDAKLLPTLYADTFEDSCTCIDCVEAQIDNASQPQIVQYHAELINVLESE